MTGTGYCNIMVVNCAIPGTIIGCKDIKLILQPAVHKYTILFLKNYILIMEKEGIEELLNFV